MTCNPVTFHNVNPSIFNCMKQKLAAAGITVPPGNSGEISGSGIIADFSWDGSANLTITIKDKPFYVTCEMAIGKLHDFVHDCGGD